MNVKWIAVLICQARCYLFCYLLLKFWNQSKAWYVTNAAKRAKMNSNKSLSFEVIQQKIINALSQKSRQSLAE